MQKVRYINDNFDFIQFNTRKMDTETINDYEFIWMYITTGAYEALYKPLNHYEFPKWLREQGVKDPKIVYQLDYWGGERNDLLPRLHDTVKYVNGFVHSGNREWKIDVPVFYQQFPVLFRTKPSWVSFDDKIPRAVSIKRYYGGIGQAREISKGLGLESVILNHDIKGKPQPEFMEYMANSLIVLDYNNRYWGWSRMVFESAVSGTPVAGDSFRKGVQIGYPELCGNDIHKIKKIISDKEKYDTIRYEGIEKLEEHLSENSCKKRIEDMIKTLGS